MDIEHENDDGDVKLLIDIVDNMPPLSHPSDSDEALNSVLRQVVPLSDSEVGGAHHPHNLPDGFITCKATDIPAVYNYAKTHGFTQKKKDQLDSAEQANYSCTNVILDSGSYDGYGRASSLKIDREGVGLLFKAMSIDLMQDRHPCLDERVYPAVEGESKINVFFDLDFLLDFAENGETLCVEHMLPVVRVIQYVVKSAFDADELYAAAFRCVATINSHVRRRGSYCKVGMHIHFPQLPVTQPVLQNLVRMVTFALHHKFPENEDGRIPCENLIITNPWSDVVDYQTVCGDSVCLRLPYNSKKDKCPCGDVKTCKLPWRPGRFPHYRSPVVHRLAVILKHDGSVVTGASRKLHNPQTAEDFARVLRLCSIRFPCDLSVCEPSDALHEWFPAEGGFLEAWYSATFRKSGDDTKRSHTDGKYEYERDRVPFHRVAYGISGALSTEQRQQLCVDLARYHYFGPDQNGVQTINFTHIDVIRNEKKRIIAYRVVVENAFECPFRLRRHNSSCVFVSITSKMMSMQCSCPKDNADDFGPSCSLQQHLPMYTPRRAAVLLFGARLCAQRPKRTKYVPDRKHFIGLQETEESIQMADRLKEQAYDFYVVRHRATSEARRSACELLSFCLRDVSAPFGSTDASLSLDPDDDFD